MDATEQVAKFNDFFESVCYQNLLHQVSKGEKFINILFSDLSKFSVELAEDLLEDPENVFQAARHTIEQMDLGGDTKNFNVRFYDLPNTSKIMIRDIRSKHIGKLLQLEGIIRQKTDVRPQATSARFECPSCGNIINVLQLDQKFQEPHMCACGRKGQFRLLHKELIDVQKLVLEESPEDLDGGEQPKRINVFSKDDLVSPISEKKTNPGSKVRMTGILKEVPIVLHTGGKSTRFDLICEANHIEPVQEEFTNIVLTDEEIKEIKELSKDPNYFEKLVVSLAPSIYGHEKIKEALLLQLMGGVRKTGDDGVSRRGDIHILLIGDPGAGKSQLVKRMSVVAPKSRFVSGKGASSAGLCVSPNSLVLTNPGGMQTIKRVVDDRLSLKEIFRPGVWKQEDIKDIKIQSMDDDMKLQVKYPKAIWKLQAPEYMFKVTLQSGKSIELTANTKLLTINNGVDVWKKSKDLKVGEYIATPRRLVGGDVKKLKTISLVSSNPVIHEIKPFVKSLVLKLKKKYGNIRKVAQALNIRENQLYFHWVNDKARSNIRLVDLKKLCDEASISLPKISSVSFYNGKVHTLPEFITKDILYSAGLIVGSGDVRRSNETIAIKLSNSDDLLLKIFSDTISKEFSLSFDRQSGSDKKPFVVRFSSKLLGEILLSLGIPLYPKSEEAFMSETLLHFSNELLSHYLAGLFDANGSVIIRKTEGIGLVEITICSEKLSRQVQLALLRFGIYSSIRKRKHSSGSIEGKIGGKSDGFVLEIHGKNNLKSFQKHIRSRHPDKNKKLAYLLKNIRTTSTNIDGVQGIVRPIKHLLKDTGHSLRILQKGQSRELVQKFLTSTSSKEIDRILNRDVFWDKVKSVDVIKSSYNYVYDLTVEDSHNFVVDGVLVHNTASVVKDEFLRGWALEAGALVLANKGLAAIDEMDKMSDEDTSAMHEALEQQTVTISKANIQANLRCETTVLAAANPKFGRFDPYELIAKQIQLPPTLINRFDLIFPVRDLPDVARDEQMATFILKLHRGEQKEKNSPVSTELMRKYIAYAKQNIFPELTDDAMSEIRKYYVQMRNQGNSEGGVSAVPISARQLEGLVRLAEASAKTRLSNKVTKKDAQRAIELVHHCLVQIGLDPETGKLDIDRITTGITASQRGHISIVKEIIAGLENAIGKIIPVDDIIREAEIKGVSEDKTTEVIEKLKRSGDLFSPKNGFISKI